MLAIRAALRGEICLTLVDAQPIQNRLLTFQEKGEPCRVTGWQAPRERVVMQLFAEVCTNRSVTPTLQISLNTEENHRVSLMNRPDAHSLAELIRRAIRQGLVLMEP